MCSCTNERALAWYSTAAVTSTGLYQTPLTEDTAGRIARLRQDLPNAAANRLEAHHQAANHVYQGVTKSMPLQVEQR